MTDLAAAKRLVRAADRVSDVVVVTMHAGAEGRDRQHVRPGTELLGENRGDPVRFAHAVVDAGADLVVGSGPHVLRGMEWYKRRLIAYSLGNFAGYDVFSLGGPLSTSGILRVTLDGAGRFETGRLVPTHMVGARAPCARPLGGGARPRPDALARGLRATRGQGQPRRHPLALDLTTGGTRLRTASWPCQTDSRRQISRERARHLSRQGCGPLARFAPRDPHPRRGGAGRADRARRDRVGVRAALPGHVFFYPEGKGFWDWAVQPPLLVVLVHEQNGWLFARSAFLHHLIGWTLVISALFPIGAAILPRRAVWAAWLRRATWIAFAVMLFADRDIAPIFGHLSDVAGGAR